VAGNSCAKAAVDMALYDIVGKALGVPVYTMLGGLYRDKATVGLELGFTKADEIPNKANKLLEMGAKAIKIHVGKNPKEDVLAIRELHDAVGSNVAIRADANGGYTTSQAIQVMRKIQDCDLEYFEQPVSRWNAAGLKTVKQSVSIPIAVDEAVWTPRDAMNICKNEAADVINIKITRVGGLNNARKIAAISSASFLRSHVGCEFEFGVGTAAKCHLCVSLENADCAATGEFSEITMLRDNIVKDCVKIKNGLLEPLNKPGLGVDLDEKKMRLYARQS
jgi:L-alanine-DL-glutamate epimerase-like enolase superfamily enzyme